MNNKIENIIKYLCKNYPHKNELSKARLTKLVYLADWFSSLVRDKQITDIEWIFNHYGPYVDDITNIAIESEEFNIITTMTNFGGNKYLIQLKNEDISIDIEEDEEKILDFVIEKTKGMYFDNFIEYVYSTYPVTSKERYSKLDLVTLAKEYKTINSFNN
ncbi:Panacea domain-containing protein [Aliarcobacter cryaerophilus]|uniref:Panacea domain-containing protein n=1 Tax=Aliarcobacter cryaerophilus TaxID=28198 RepID=UPI000826DEF5|nr:Panacea domain-containing protein [Aliarcobacter cryaerophilus]